MPGGLDLIVPDWPAPPGISGFFTTRAGGASEGEFASLNLGLHVGDNEQAVRENRRRLVALLPAEPLWLNQVHGTSVITINDDNLNVPVADASSTRLSRRPCAVLVADCLPVLFCDNTGSSVAAAHAGWRGLAAGVLERTVESMSVTPANVMAWMGPAIGASAFEVGQDVVDSFAQSSSTARAAFQAIEEKPGKYLADIYLLARQRLESAGVKQVYGGQFCTVSDPSRFFSYRRDGRCGRMAAVIWRE
ncbi:MAG: peptidoglycan editing factor PgeF [Betaproteobacteria bacterium]